MGFAGAVGGLVASGAGSGIAKSLRGGQGDFYQPTNKDAAYNQAQAESDTAAKQSYGADYMRDLQQGTSPEKAMREIWERQASITDNNLKGPQERAIMSDPLLGSIIAQQQLQSGPLTSALYGGKGGSELSRALEDVNKTREPGYYGLNEGDQTAYGQSSGQLARMFGQGEQDLAQSLANRGLGAAPSGVAGQQFSGLQGNKMEQFAGLQRQIADQAMQRQMQQSQMLRNYATGLAGQQSGDIQAQYGRQMQGVQTGREPILNMANLEQQNNNMTNQQNMASMQDKRASYAPGFGEMFGAGLNQSGQMIGSAPGTFVQGAAGKAGAGMGGRFAGGQEGAVAAMGGK